MRNCFSKAALAFLVMLVTTSLYAQQKEITLEEIWGGKFTPRTLEELRPMNDGKHYSVIEFEPSKGASVINKYNYKSGEKVAALVEGTVLPGRAKIDSYLFSADESKVLLGTDLKSIYRHSKSGHYFIYDLNEKLLLPLSLNEVQEPTFSPDGTKIAYVFENNLFVKDLMTRETRQLTHDGKTNAIINGITDWVYEEEFAFVRAYEWSSDAKKIAFLRFDETEVPEFSMDVYGTQLYPQQQVFKYPKAGENNSVVSLHVYNLEQETSHTIDLSDYQQYYLPRLKWTKDPEVFSIQGLNRKQNILDLVFVNATTFETERVLQETDAAYVEVTNDLTFLNSNSFLWTSEKDGWNHIYLYDRNGKLQHQLTEGDWEVTKLYGFDPVRARVYYQSTENGSINRDVYSVARTGKNKIRLTQKTGTNKAQFSADFSVFINEFSNTETPTMFTLHSGLDGAPIREIKNNDDLESLLNGYEIAPKEFSTIDINGESLNMYTIKPLDFDASKEYPLFMFQYSGPGSQRVANRWNTSNDYWHQLLAQKGFVVVCVDGRGTGLKGRDFKKMTQLELGKYEVQDQIAVAEKLGQLPYIDEDRMGIWGWSYGGFMSANALFQGSDTFSMAIAVAPVTSWRFYDSIYTERYMSTPQENPSGYDDNSPLSHVNKLKGDFLLVHGTADDNVHFQNTMRLTEALIQANKDFDWRVYPDDNHGIYGGNTRLHLYRLMTEFVMETLGEPEEKTLELKQ